MHTSSIVDVSQLVWSLGHISSSVTEERHNAEKYLKHGEAVPGFLISLFQVLSRSDEEIPLHTKHAASVIFKQYIVKDLDKTVHENVVKLSTQEKYFIKSNIVELTIQSTILLRKQLGVVFRKMADRDYPHDWPDLLPKLITFITAPQQREILIPGSLFVLRNLCKIYNYRTPDGGRRDSLYAIVDCTFPYLLIIFQNLLNLNSLAAAEMIILICKIFSTSIQFSLPPNLMDFNVLTPWINALLLLLTKEIPLDQQPLDPQHRHKWPWWRAKKWVGIILTTLFTRYSSKSSDDELVKAFGPQFMSSFAPSMLHAFLTALCPIGKGVSMPDRFVHIGLNFVLCSVRISSTYLQLKPVLHPFLTDIVFPLLCFNESDTDCWSEDPEEFLRKEYDLIDEYYSAKKTAISLVVNIMNLRPKGNFDFFMSFLVNILTRYNAEPSGKKPQEKYGVLLAMGSLSQKLMKHTSYNASLEDFIAYHVIPEFQNPNGFLRAKACWIFGQFAEIEYKNEMIFIAGLEQVLSLMKDKDIPVRVQAALTIKTLIGVEQASKEIAKILPIVLEEFFNLMSEVDNDDLVSALEVIIHKYSDQIPPFAVNICSRLAEAFLRVSADEDDENSALAALEYLRTIQTVLVSISKMPHLYPQVEAVLLPLLIKSLENNYLEYFEQILRTMTFITYYSPTITPSMWALFPLIYKWFNEYGSDFISEILVVLDNYISRGTETFLAPGTNYLDLVFNMYQKMLEDRTWMETDVGEGCKLIEVVLHYSRSSARVEQLLPHIVHLAARRLQFAERKTFIVLLLQVICNCLYFNPVATLASLERIDQTQVVFSKLFSHVFVDFKRFHDKKVTVLGLSSIYSLPFTSLPPTLRSGFSQIFAGLLQLLVDMKSTKEDDNKPDALSNEEEEELGIDIIDGEFVQDDEDVEDLKTIMENDCVREFGAGDLDDFEDEDVEDDPSYSTAIDDVNELLYFVEKFQSAANREREVYHNLVETAHLKERTAFAMLVEHANSYTLTQ
eukprot:TRINITY_DN4851_c0_g1_i1.p1 TRINITY_DN4851_c0_g1~~TRINITY_DN4851_c0_g1_i1.p1  ORF type:complete len:1011 (-),score=143.11 TRINITY_DN4851_c0_g1_i1:224-3256(-)